MRRGFTLIGLVVALAILAMLSAGAAYYYQETIDEYRAVRVRNDLKSIVQAWLAWQARTGRDPADLNELQPFLPDGCLLDPWYNPYELDLGDRCVRCRPASSRDGATGSLPLEIEEPLPPKAVQPAPAPGPTKPADHVAPCIERVAPVGQVASKRPEVTAAWSDAGTGVDPAGVRLFLDGRNVTAAAAVSEAGLSWTPAEDLPAGLHQALVQARDWAGNLGERPWTFTTP